MLSLLSMDLPVCRIKYVLWTHESMVCTLEWDTNSCEWNLSRTNHPRKKKDWSSHMCAIRFTSMRCGRSVFEIFVPCTNIFLFLYSQFCPESIYNTETIRCTILIMWAKQVNTNTATMIKTIRRRSHLSFSWINYYTCCNFIILYCTPQFDINRC